MKEISFRCVDIDFLNKPILNESKGLCYSKHVKTSVAFSVGEGKRSERAVVCIFVFLPLCSNILLLIFMNYVQLMYMHSEFIY